MERELWSILYPLIQQTARLFSQKYVQHQPWVIAAVSLWAALHDRPTNWACDPRNWGNTTRRPRNLPSPSTMSRRGHCLAVGAFRLALERAIRDAHRPSLLAIVDGKPLAIPAISGDRDAGFGRGAREKSKGYKLHMVTSTRPMPEAWEITPIQASETKVAEGMAVQLGHGGYLLGDGNYDANGVFDALGERGYALRTPHPHPNAGRGHHYQSEHRLASIQARGTDFSKQLLRQRGEIERHFGTLTSFACGLKPLPAWVRRLHRVRTWVWDKLFVNAARIIKNQQLASPLQ